MPLFYHCKSKVGATPTTMNFRFMSLKWRRFYE